MHIFIIHEYSDEGRSNLVNVVTDGDLALRIVREASLAMHHSLFIECRVKNGLHFEVAEWPGKEPLESGWVPTGFSLFRDYEGYEEVWSSNSSRTSS